jgi:hypothetical protein
MKKALIALVVAACFAAGCDPTRTGNADVSTRNGRPVTLIQDHRVAFLTPGKVQLELHLRKRTLVLYPQEGEPLSVRIASELFDKLKQGQGIFVTRAMSGLDHGVSVEVESHFQKGDGLSLVRVTELVFRVIRTDVPTDEPEATIRFLWEIKEVINLDAPSAPSYDKSERHWHGNRI